MAYRGVNLGGWLVLEKWMTPSLFAHSRQVDEIGLSSEAEYAKIITRHHQSFITEHDIQWLARHGVTHLRVPIGYWLFGDHPPLANGIQHLDALFTWAESYDMNILLSIHGAPGSQNGKHHSGKVGEVAWKNHKDTLGDFTASIIERYSDSPALWGVCLLNEPTHRVSHFGALFRHYRRIARTLRRRTPHVRLFIDATFQPLQWAVVAKMLGVGIDMHLYHGFGYADYTVATKRLRTSERLLKKIGKVVPVIIGEWSGVLHHKGTQYEQKAYISAQQRIYQQAQANFYWTYKTESGGVWSFKDLVNKKLIK